jgi:hypothetical protein
VNGPKPAEPRWKRITILALWLGLALPIGLWKLYHDPILSASTKWRILIYLCVLPMLAYFTLSIWMASTSLQRLLP